MKTIELGKTKEGKRLMLDLAILTQKHPHMVLAAGSGQGKSHLIRRICEQSFNQVQTILFDPEGEFNTLREKYPFGLIGPGGETPASIKTAALAARNIIEHKVPVIIDLSDLPSPANEEYVRLFIKAAMETKKKHWHPILFIIDEAVNYAPANAKLEDKANQPYWAIHDMIRRGRKRGFSLILAATRLVSLNNNITNTRNLLVGGSGKPVDQDRHAELMGMRKGDSHIFQELEAGEFFAQGPIFGIQGSKLFKSGPIQTTHEHDVAYDVPPVPKNASKVMEFLSNLPADVQAEQDLVKRLQTENAELKRKQMAQPQPERVKVVERVEVSRVPQELVAQVKQFTDALKLHSQTMARDSEAMLMRVLEIAEKNPERVAIMPAIAPPKTDYDKMAPIIPIGTPAAFIGSPSEIPEGWVQVGAPKLKLAERKILTALAQYDPQPLDKNRLAVLTGYAANGGGFNNALGALRSQRFISGDTTSIRIESAGMVALGPYDPLPTGPELVEYWAKQLKKAERECFTVLCKAWPTSVSKDALAHATGYTAGGGGFNNALGKLRTLKLIEGSKELRASDHLFGGA